MEFEKRSKEEFGALMRQLREEKGITREEMSEVSGMSVKQIEKFEREGSDMPVTTFIRVCVALGIKNPDEVIYKMK